MACQFYKLIFKETTYPQEIETLPGDSSTKNAEMGRIISKAETDAASGKIATSADELVKAYLLSPQDPRLLAVPLDQKLLIKKFAQQLVKLESALDARDLAHLSDLLDLIHQTAPDFDASKATTAANAIRSNGTSFIEKGKIAIRSGDFKTALDAFQRAEQIWPGDPDLGGSALKLFYSEEAKAENRSKFDQLITTHDYAGVAQQAQDFTAIIHDDVNRAEELKNALKIVHIADKAITEADNLKLNGDADGAWETIQPAIHAWPDNVALQKMQDDLAIAAAHFVEAIQNAQDAESRRELGYSLNWYVIARTYYPPSKIAQEAIERLTAKILSMEEANPSEPARKGS